MHGDSCGGHCAVLTVLFSMCCTVMCKLHSVSSTDSSFGSEEVTQHTTQRAVWAVCRANQFIRYVTKKATHTNDETTEDSRPHSGGCVKQSNGNVRGAYVSSAASTATVPVRVVHVCQGFKASRQPQHTPGAPHAQAGKQRGGGTDSFSIQSLRALLKFFYSLVTKIYSGSTTSTPFNQTTTPSTNKMQQQKRTAD